MRFDAYAATVRDSPTAVLDRLSEGLGAVPQQARPRNGYEFGTELHAGGAVVARVFHGGRNGAPHALAQGEWTDDFVRVVREAWPVQHRVTRMDSAEDFDGPGTWDRLYGTVSGLALEKGLAFNQMGDWIRFERGRTFYVGAEKSAVRLRLYEKGKQVQQLAVERGPVARPDWCRVELQVRPEGFTRDLAAGFEPQDAYGCAAWSQLLADRLLGLSEVQRVHIKERRATDLERMEFWLVRHYGEALEKLAAEYEDGWAEVGRRIGREKRRQDAAREHR